MSTLPRNDSALAAAQMAGAGAGAEEAPTRRTGAGRSQHYPGAKTRVAQTSEQVLKTATSFDVVESCVMGMSSSIDIEMAAVAALFANCMPVDELLDEGRKLKAWDATFGEVDDALAIAKIYDRFGCLPSQIPEARRGFMTANFFTVCQRVADVKRDDLKELYLSGLDLIILPGGIEQLTALTHLYASNNQLTALPAELGQLTALTVLYASDNQLTALPPELGQLTALTQFNLRNNLLTELPAELGQLTGLRHFNLGNNQLTALPPELGQLTALTRFDARNNQLGVLPAELRGLPIESDVPLRFSGVLLADDDLT